MPRLARTLLASCTAAVGLGLAGAPADAFEIKPEARLHVDYGSHDDASQPMEDGWIVRRAVVGLEGKFSDDWAFELGYTLSSDGRIRPGEGEYRDVSLTWEGWAAGDLTIGQFKLPFSLEELASSNNTTLIERALPVDAFAPSRRLGIGFEHQGKLGTFAAMAFGSSIDGSDQGRGVAARATVLPLDSGERRLHLGIAAVIEKPRSKVDFDAAPESRVPDVDLVNTGGIDDVSRIDRLGLEAAWQAGPWSVQGEWLQADVRRDAGLGNARLDGWYVTGSWVLTGEARRYKNGGFKDIEPARGSGAWELTARYSSIDLDDGDVRGGNEQNLTLGVNYYLNEHLRIMLNHISVRSERRGQDDDPHLLLLRAQFVL